MILWQTAKRWRYRGRQCEIQRTDVDDATQYRGLVEVETGLSDRALDAAPVDDPRRKNRPKRHEDGEYREWVCFGWSEEDSTELSSLREAVHDLAEHVRETEV
jgi:hypothetical protein